MDKLLDQNGKFKTEEYDIYCKALLALKWALADITPKNMDITTFKGIIIEAANDIVDKMYPQ